MARGIAYTIEEQAYLRSNAMALPLQEMADHLGRSEKAVRSWFNKRHIQTRKDSYSLVEESYIRSNAGILPWNVIAEHLGRSEQGITIWASRNGVSGSYVHPRERNFLGLESRVCGGLFCMAEFIPIREGHRFCSDQCSMSTNRLTAYNLTKDSWWALFVAQGEKCVCGDDTPDLMWHIDHDHSCCPRGESCGKCVRGILCHHCNLALGLVRDNPDTLRALASYLESQTSLISEEK